MSWAVPIIVAVIGGPLMWLLHRLEKRNTEQHGRSMGLLTTIHDDIRKIDDRLHDHIVWHADKEGTDGSVRGSKQSD